MSTNEMSPDEKKTVAEFEQEQNVILLGDVDLKKKMTRQEFMDLIAYKQGEDQNNIGIVWDQRIEWLENNGYEVTRENIADASLVSKGV